MSRAAGRETAARFGLAFQSDKQIADYARLAEAAEAAGFDVISVYGDLYFQPPIVALMAMAAATRRVALGPACLNPFMVHPVEIAGQVAALDAASGGRAYVGLARGSWLKALGVDQSGGAEAVAEAAAVVAALLSGDRAGVEGSRFRLPPGACLCQRGPRAEIPILVGTWGPRLAGLAAGFADEVKVGGSANPEMVGVMRRWLDQGNPAGRRVEIVMGAVTVVDEDGKAARRLAREEVAMYLEVVGELDPTVELDPELVLRLGEQLRAGDRRAAGSLVPDAVLDRFAFAGTPEEVARKALTLVEAGAARIEFGTPHGLSAENGVGLLGERVLPGLRAELA